MNLATIVHVLRENVRVMANAIDALADLVDGRRPTKKKPRREEPVAREQVKPAPKKKHSSKHSSMKMADVLAKLPDEFSAADVRKVSPAQGSVARLFRTGLIKTIGPQRYVKTAGATVLFRSKVYAANGHTKLTPELREKAMKLRSEGISFRKIGAALGVADKTIRTWLHPTNKEDS